MKKTNILHRIILLTMVVLAMGCKAKKAVVAAPVKSTEPVNNQKAENLALLRSKDLNFTTLSLKAKASIDMNGAENNVSMNIRMKKDQKIWVSITAIAGIEVARALITPDSILLMNKLQATYVSKPFSYIHNFSNKQISFKMLQSILTGNTIAEFMVGMPELTMANGVWTVTGNNGDLGFRILFNTLLKAAETNLNDAKSGQALKVVYDEYQQVNGSLFPTVLKISSMSGTKRIGIDLNFSKVESNVSLDFPFTVPKRYQVIN